MHYPISVKHTLKSESTGSNLPPIVLNDWAHRPGRNTIINNRSLQYTNSLMWLEVKRDCHCS
ncbi:hypothetical protein Hanom_Chr10g00941061 [Helianthus anomalus]